MIFFGVNSTILGHSLFPKGTCANCQRQDWQMAVIQPYFHIYWLSVFPLPKKAVLICGHCKMKLAENEVAPVVHGDLKATKQTYRTPLWNFVGVALIAFFLAFVILKHR